MQPPIFIDVRIVSALARGRCRESSFSLMSSLRDKNIILISPNNWGAMRVSKHHYAVELARRGNRVVFLNPPDRTAQVSLRIEKIPEVCGLSVVTYRPFVSFNIRFHVRALFNVIAAAHVHWLLQKLGMRFDIVWCFDANLYSDLRWFRAPVRIFYPVDQVVEQRQRAVAATASVILSVSEEILQHVRSYGIPCYALGHGLGSTFVERAEEKRGETVYSPTAPVRVGYVGNLFIKYLDRPTIQILVLEHPETEFHFWGPVSPAESNVDAFDTPETGQFLTFLREQPNVVLHGKQPPAVIAEELDEMDLLLICYATAADPNRGCNSHKILEYLVTGRVIVSNYVRDYADRPDLIVMVPTTDNSALPSLFDSVLADLGTFNGADYRRVRVEYALAHTYSKQIERIESILDGTDLTKGRR